MNNFLWVVVFRKDCTCQINKTQKPRKIKNLKFSHEMHTRRKTGVATVCTERSLKEKDLIDRLMKMSVSTRNLLKTESQ